MRPNAHVLAAVLLSISAFSASAAELVKADAAKVLEVAKGFGSATLEKDGTGDPKITGRINGLKYGIYFYSCKSGKCEDIQFASGFSDVTVSSNKINEWNKGKRFGRAYVNDDNNPRIEMDVLMKNGISKDTLEDAFSTWSVVMTSFQQFVQ